MPAHRCASSAMKDANACRVPVRAWAAGLARLALASAEPRFSKISALSFATISGDTPAGATMPVHDTATKPGRPLSIMVGTLGNSSLRAVLVMEIGRTLLSWVVVSGAEVGCEVV